MKQARRRIAPTTGPEGEQPEGYQSNRREN